MAVDGVGKMEETLTRWWTWFSRPMVMRYTMMTLHAIDLCVFFVLAILQGVFLFIPSALAILFALLYCPGAVVVACKRSKRAFDRTGTEVSYLSIQALLWLVIVIFGLHFRGPSYCAKLNYQLGLAESFGPADLDGNASDAVLHSCDVDTALNVFSCLHLLLLLVWLGWIIRRTRRIDMERDLAFRCSTWRMLKGEYANKSSPKQEIAMVSSPALATSTQGHSIATANSISPDLQTLYGNSVGSAIGDTSHLTMSVPGPSQSLPPVTIAAMPIVEEPPPAYIDSATHPSRSIGGTMSIEEFMRNRQLAMEEKLALDRQERARQSGLLGREGQESHTVLGEASSSSQLSPRRRLSY